MNVSQKLHTTNCSSWIRPLHSGKFSNKNYPNNFFINCYYTCNFPISLKLYILFYNSEPELVASGQNRVTVTLPRFQNKSFHGYSRDVNLAKWGAARTAVNKLKNLKNAFIPVKQKELLNRYTGLHPSNEH